MNDQYKNMFKGIIIFLVTAVILLFLSIMLPSCRSQKESNVTTKENVEVAKAASSTTETAARSQWSRSLSIDLDSFEMFMPLPYVDTAISHPELSPYSPEAKPYTAGGARYAVLRGKRATIGKSTWPSATLRDAPARSTALPSTARWTQPSSTPATPWPFTSPLMSPGGR